MTGEHAGCCCSHNDHHDDHHTDHQDNNHDQRVEVVQSPKTSTVTANAGCCGGAKEEETSRPIAHAGHSTKVRNPS